MGRANSLKISGEENISIYRSAKNDRNHYDEDGRSKARRHFCSKCGSALWVHGSDWPDYIYPFVSAIDSPLPPAPENTHLMLAHKANWIKIEIKDHDVQFEYYPDTGIEDWHKQRGLYGND